MFEKIKGLFEKHPEEEEIIETVEEIMDEREERGDDVLVDDDEMLMVKNIFKLRDKRAGDVAIPRAEIVAISVHAKQADLKKIILENFVVIFLSKLCLRFCLIPIIKSLSCLLFQNFGNTSACISLSESV